MLEYYDLAGESLTLHNRVVAAVKEQAAWRGRASYKSMKITQSHRSEESVHIETRKQDQRTGRISTAPFKGFFDRTVAAMRGDGESDILGSICIFINQTSC